MTTWYRRPIEIRNLFNPAFCALVLCRSFNGFEESNEGGMPFSLSLLVLPLCLHKESREIINGNNRSYLLKVIERNPQLVVGFETRVTNMLPFTFEGLGLAMQFGCIQVEKTGSIKGIPETVQKTVSGTDETKAIQRAARTIGKGFAETIDRVTIYTSLGIRP